MHCVQATRPNNTNASAYGTVAQRPMGDDALRLER